MNLNCFPLKLLSAFDCMCECRLSTGHIYIRFLKRYVSSPFRCAVSPTLDELPALVPKMRGTYVSGVNRIMVDSRLLQIQLRALSHKNRSERLERLVA